MSFDITVQAFENGEAASRDGAAVRRRLLEVAKRYEPETSFVEVGDDAGPAEIYGVPAEGAPLEGLTFSRTGAGGFDLLVEIARMADLVALPPGCPVCIVREGQRSQLPPELAAYGVELVDSGAALLAVIERR